MDFFGVVLALARGLHLATMLSVFGCLIATLVLEPAAFADATPAQRQRVTARLRRLLLASAFAAGGTAVIWIVVQSADMAGATSLTETLQAVPIAVLRTRFGFALLFRLAILAVIVANVMLGHRRRASGWLVLLAALALVAQSWMGHPGAADDGVLLGASMLHILAAGAWLGGLAPLFILVAGVGGIAAGRAAERFSWVGTTAVLILSVTAGLQAWKLLGNEGGWFGTDYGWLALGKLVMFSGLLSLAAINRFRLTPALRSDQAIRAGRHLRLSIVIEAGIGLLVVCAAASMATLAPAAHQQPEWPFPLRPNMALLQDADVRFAFIEAALLGVVALGLLVRAALFARWRIAMVVLAGGLLWYGNTVIDNAPFIDPMLIAGNTASYYQSPSGFTAASITDGGRLFAANCVVCHGKEGHGDGPAAAGLPVKPANLTLDHVWAHSDGEMFWWISHGIPTSKGTPLMPGFADALSEDDRWALIDYVHAHLAGAAMQRTGKWTQPVKPPATEAVCRNGETIDLEDLRGRFVRVVAEPTEAVPVAGVDAVTIVIARAPAETADCVASGTETWQAYATMAGLTPEQLPGTVFLVDPNGWLRARLLPADMPTWSKPGALLAMVADIAAHPIAEVGGGHHHH